MQNGIVIELKFFCYFSVSLITLVYENRGTKLLSSA